MPLQSMISTRGGACRRPQTCRVWYFGRMRRRMDSRGFPHTAELLRAADKAYSTARDLSITLHDLFLQQRRRTSPMSPQQSGPFAAWARREPR